ncbi:Sugar transporter [Arboricoccus pini]|uniref:Sugar transporter n=1 Tax=Arboricoccus pini TaxID=1963835 RepID=A0A212RV13_9PROT|nr:MFS transporter [Arboricoccus pini]SNB76387.1 Sugar transporter [Arboricoccus pini]
MSAAGTGALTQRGMAPARARTAEEQAGLRRVILSSILGSILEWYDFYLYGTASALIFSQLFFTSLDPTTGVIASFSTLALGFIARPIGGLFFGGMGDRLGRKKVLLITMLLMGGATAIVGLLPTYASIGLWAPLILCLCRLLQGFAAGGEYASAVALTTEHAPGERRGFFASLPGIGVSAGILLSAALFSLFRLMPEDAFMAWGWRLPFLLSLLVVAIGSYVRLRVQESPVFEQLKEEAMLAAAPVREVFASKDARRNLFVAFGARFAEITSVNVFQVWILSYLAAWTTSAQGVGLIGIQVGQALSLISIPLFGALSDKVGRKPVYMGGAIFMGFFVWPFFAMLHSGQAWQIVPAMAIMLAVAYQAMFAAQASYFSELFAPRLRVTGFTTAREITAAVLGGPASIIATAITASAAGGYWPVATFMVAMCIVTSAALIIGPETHPGLPRNGASLGSSSSTQGNQTP